MRASRVRYSRKTSRTWAAYSSVVHRSGTGRAPQASTGASSTSIQRSAMSADHGRRRRSASTRRRRSRTPGTASSRTHVQSLSSGTMASVIDEVCAASLDRFVAPIREVVYGRWHEVRLRGPLGRRRRRRRPRGSRRGRPDGTDCSCGSRCGASTRGSRSASPPCAPRRSASARCSPRHRAGARGSWPARSPPSTGCRTGG